MNFIEEEFAVFDEETCNTLVGLADAFAISKAKFIQEFVEKLNSRGAEITKHLVRNGLRQVKEKLYSQINSEQYGFFVQYKAKQCRRTEAATTKYNTIRQAMGRLVPTIEDVMDFIKNVSEVNDDTHASTVDDSSCKSSFDGGTDIGQLTRPKLAQLEQSDEFNIQGVQENENNGSPYEEEKNTTSKPPLPAPNNTTNKRIRASTREQYHYVYVAIHLPSSWSWKFGCSCSTPYSLTRPYVRANSEIIYFWRLRIKDDAMNCNSEQYALNLESNAIQHAINNQWSVNSLQCAASAAADFSHINATDKTKLKKGGFEVMKCGENYSVVMAMIKFVIGAFLKL